MTSLVAQYSSSIAFYEAVTSQFQSMLSLLLGQETLHIHSISGRTKDSQSLRGKVVIGVSRRAKRLNIPVLAVVGDVGDSIDEAYREGVTAIFSTNRLAIPFSEAKHRSKKDYRLTIENLFRALSALETKA